MGIYSRAEVDSTNDDVDDDVDVLIIVAGRQRNHSIQRRSGRRLRRQITMNRLVLAYSRMRVVMQMVVL